MLVEILKVSLANKNGDASLLVYG